MIVASPTHRPRRTVLWWGLVFAALAVGYGDLWRGGITIGPIMLVLAYCVLVPIAIVRRS